MADLHMTASSKIATVTIQDKFGMSTNPISRKASFNTGASVGINTLQRPTRRLSVRDNVLEENIAGTIQSSTAATENSSGAVPTVTFHFIICLHF